MRPEPLARRLRWRGITDHYGRILNLTAVPGCTSNDEASVLIAKAIRDEPCEAYFRLCDRIFHAWGRCIGEM